jgi:LuxR family maltose regulon positive regulatory protein
MDERSAMTLVATKLTAPAPPARLVQRSRLDRLLTAAVADSNVRVILVSAPAGSGKSTLVAAWLNDRAETHAWLQIGSADNDPARFWTYLVAALSREMPEVESAVAPVVPTASSDPGPLVERLVSVVGSGSAPIVLVLDDYHLITNAAVNDGVERLIELAPTSLTLVLCSRVDPSLRLSRLRVRGQLAEVRADLLRFVPDEASSLLRHGGASPPPHQIEVLCERTEGWAAGLVLAGMSLAASNDGDAFVAAFQGDDRLVVDYLTEEFLSGVTAEERDRLLRSSVLNRMCGPLVDAVCGTTDGATWLRDTASTNQLLIRLDRTGTWYRFHHLLADLLRLESRHSIGNVVGELHARAGRWHHEHGDPHEAVEHYLHGGHLSEAADLIYDEATELMNRGQLATVRNQIERLGPLADEHAGALVVRGWIALLTSRFAEARRCLDLARTLEPNEDEAGLAVALAIMTHIATGDVTGALDEARSAPDPFESTQAMTLGGARVWGGDFEGAQPFLCLAAEMAPGEGNTFVEAVTPIFQAIADIECADARSARRHALRAIDIAAANGFDELAQTALAHSLAARTSDDVDAAILAARRGVELARKSPEKIMLAYALASAGDVMCHQNDPTGPDMVLEAQSIVDRCPDPGIAKRYLDRVEARHQLGSVPPTPTELVDDLTDRELAVLRYLPSPLSQRDIASELYVSLNTVKTHCRAIYRKLGVGDRKAAIQAARDLGLL